MKIKSPNPISSIYVANNGAYEMQVQGFNLQNNDETKRINEFYYIPKMTFIKEGESNLKKKFNIKGQVL